MPNGDHGGDGLGVAVVEPPEPTDSPSAEAWLWDKPPKWWWFLAALVTAAVVAFFVIQSFNNWPLGSGDPDGVRLTQLQALRAVVPAGSSIFDEGSQEPDWIASCADEYFHRGWTIVQYGFEFRPKVPSTQVLPDVSRAMARQGWIKTTVSSGAPTWTRVLPSGSNASVTLSAPLSGTSWAISANATPAAPVGECGGG